MNENALDKGQSNGSKETGVVLFGSNRYFEFLYKKSEKIGIALYMVTNFIKDTDPIKHSIRENSLRLLSTVLALATADLSSRKVLMKEYEGCAMQVLSLLSMAFHSGFISEMNFSVIKSEIERTLETLSRKDENREGGESVLFSQDFFDMGQGTVPKNFPESIKDKDVSHEQVGSHSKETNRYQAPIGSSRFPLKDKISSSQSHTVSKKKDSREQIILDLLKKREGLSIKDFADAITDCSEKTIQRELIYMVDQGIIRKEGERRWSRYYLAK